MWAFPENTDLDSHRWEDIMNAGATIQQAGGPDGKVGEVEARSIMCKVTFFLNKCVYFLWKFSLDIRVLLCQTFNVNSKWVTL